MLGLKGVKFIRFFNIIVNIKCAIIVIFEINTFTIHNFIICNMKSIGILLIIAGLGLTIFTTAKFFTKEKVVDIGSLEISREKPHYFSWPSGVGLLIIGIGGIILWQDSKK